MNPLFTPAIQVKMETFSFFDAEAVFNVLKTWLTSYSLTPDEIPFSFIKNVAHTIAYPLSYLYNQSIMFTEVPTLWKHSYVTPILKSHPSSEPTNYRPVSITSLFFKVFEKLLKPHLMEHLAKNCLIPSAQHGFVKGKYVESNMLESLNDWTIFLDNKMVWSLVLTG